MRAQFLLSPKRQTLNRLQKYFRSLKDSLANATTPDTDHDLQRPSLKTREDLR
ncbi:hypothetical protein JCM15831A_21860 [Asaia astilbis]